jgi:hypothetical protein
MDPGSMDAMSTGSTTSPSGAPSDYPALDAATRANAVWLENGAQQSASGANGVASNSSPGGGGDIVQWRLQIFDPSDTSGQAKIIFDFVDGLEPGTYVPYGKNGNHNGDVAIYRHGYQDGDVGDGFWFFAVNSGSYGYEREESTIVIAGKSDSAIWGTFRGTLCRDVCVNAPDGNPCVVCYSLEGGRFSANIGLHP